MQIGLVGVQDAGPAGAGFGQQVLDALGMTSSLSGQTWELSRDQEQVVALTDHEFGAGIDSWHRLATVFTEPALAI